MVGANILSKRPTGAQTRRGYTSHEVTAARAGRPAGRPKQAGNEHAVYPIPMPPEFQAIFDDWSPPALLTTTIVLTAILYMRGWFAIRKTRRLLFPPWRLAAFLLGLATIWLAVASPLDGFADVLLSAHMIEHLLLMSFAAPLLLLGYPAVPLLRGLPRPLTIHLLGPFLRAK
jgi:putative membrane protein